MTGLGEEASMATTRGQTLIYVKVTLQSKACV